MTRKAGMVRVEIDQATAILVLCWMGRKHEKGSDWFLKLAPKAAPFRHLMSELDHFHSLKSAERREVSLCLLRVARWDRRHFDFPRHVAAYLAGIDLQAAVDDPTFQSPMTLAALALSSNCSKALRGRGRPKRTDDTVRARLARFEGNDLSIDAREARRLKRHLSRITWLAMRAANGGTLLTGGL